LFSAFFPVFLIDELLYDITLLVVNVKKKKIGNFANLF